MTGSQVLLVVTSETGNVYDYSTPKFKTVVDECRAWLRISRDAPQPFDLSSAATSAAAAALAPHPSRVSSTSSIMHQNYSSEQPPAPTSFQNHIADADALHRVQEELHSDSRALDLIANAALAFPMGGGSTTSSAWPEEQRGRKREREEEGISGDGGGIGQRGTLQRSAAGEQGLWEGRFRV